LLVGLAELSGESLGGLELAVSLHLASQLGQGTRLEQQGVGASHRIVRFVEELERLLVLLGLDRSERVPVTFAGLVLLRFGRVHHRSAFGSRRRGPRERGTEREQGDEVTFRRAAKEGARVTPRCRKEHSSRSLPSICAE